MPFQKGNIPWNRGKKSWVAGKKHPMWGKRASDETREKMSAAHKGRPNDGHFKKGETSWNKGKKMSLESREKLSQSSMGRAMSAETKQKISVGVNKVKYKFSGENHYNWKGGVRPEYRKIRASTEFRNWRGAVFERDDWTCLKCKIRGGKLHPHHIENFADYPKVRFDTENGATLCEKCHGEFHRKYGQTKTSREQLEEFLLWGGELNGNLHIQNNRGH